jgi:hypothetical protein
LVSRIGEYKFILGRGQVRHIQLHHKLSGTNIKIRVPALVNKEVNSTPLIAIASRPPMVSAEIFMKTCFLNVLAFFWNVHLARLLKSFVIY